MQTQSLQGVRRAFIQSQTVSISYLVKGVARNLLGCRTYFTYFCQGRTKLFG